MQMQRSSVFYFYKTKIERINQGKKYHFFKFFER